VAGYVQALPSLSVDGLGGPEFGAG